MTTKEVLTKYPRIVSHLICESLGYFTPNSAAQALVAAKENRPYFCEWYSWIAGDCTRGSYDATKVTEVTNLVLSAAIRNRQQHKGYMSDYQLARQCVSAELKGKGPSLASWF